MAIFSLGANLLMKTVLLSAAILPLLLGGLIWIVPTQDYNTEQHFAPRQPDIMAAPMVMAALSGCGPEVEPSRSVPYVAQPPEPLPANPRAYATAFTNAGYAKGVLLKHLMGRPIKVEGNPAHPASLGAAGAVMQASILSLYDPRRAQSIVGDGHLRSWPEFVVALYGRRRPSPS